MAGLPKTVPLPDIFARATASKPPAASGLSPAEQEFLRVTNQARARENLPILRPNPALCELARAHALRMARFRQTAYELDSRSLPDEVEARFPEQSYALALGSSQVLECSLVLDSWLKDARLRQHLLDREYEEAGVGIARDGPTGLHYFVEILQAPKK